MKRTDIAVWTVAVIVGPIAYVCVAMAAWVIWPSAGKVMLGVLVGSLFFPEWWVLLWRLYTKAD